LAAKVGARISEVSAPGATIAEAISSAAISVAGSRNSGTVSVDASLDSSNAPTIAEGVAPTDSAANASARATMPDHARARLPVSRAIIAARPVRNAAIALAMACLRSKSQP
jgi:hypothetical protein